MLLSSEFQLAIACCRWPASVDDRQRVAAAAARVDWDLFVSTIHRHRIAGLAWRGLRDAGVQPPPAAADALARAAAEVARHGLRCAAESLRLTDKFRTADISPLFLKGVSLAALAYGDIGLKAGWDIDLLVAPDDLQAAAALLGEAGYELVTPQTLGRLSAWHSVSKESVWRNRSLGVHLELHTALTDNPMLIPEIGIASPRQVVAVGRGMQLQTLADAPLFAYLCVHGASSAWFRMKWIADLAAWLSGRKPAEIEALHLASQSLGAGRAADQALLLCSRLFGTVLPPDLEAKLRARLISRCLASAALSCMTANREPRFEPTSSVLIHLTQFGLLPGWPYGLEEGRGQWRRFLLNRRPTG